MMAISEGFALVPFSPLPSLPVWSPARRPPDHLSLCTQYSVSQPLPLVSRRAAAVGRQITIQRLTSAGVETWSDWFAAADCRSRDILAAQLCRRQHQALTV